MKPISLRRTALDLIVRIDRDAGFSHLLLNKEINTKQLNKKDEALLTQIVYGTFERKLTLNYYLKKFIDPKKKIEPWVSALLAMSVYQMVYLDKVPDHAIIHEAVDIAKEKGHKGIAGFVNGVLRNIQRKGVPDLEEIKDSVEKLSIQTSHPRWLVDRWIEQYGFETTVEICEANITRKDLSVRVQPLKISREQAIRELEAEGFIVRPSIFSEQGLIIEKGNILTSELFKTGKLTIQDQSSMLVGELLNVTPGMTVLDTCSAPGGKVTHIAEKMQDEGKVYAHDLHKKKVKLIEEKAAQLNLTVIQAEEADARKLTERYDKEIFDRILVDAPCSGLGVIHSKPEIKYEKSPEDIERLQTIQLDILNEAGKLLKQDGLMVYSTCTIEKTENVQVIQKFLEENPQYSVDKSFFEELPGDLKDAVGRTVYGFQLFPQTHGTDGFFLTRLKKIN